MNIRKNIVTQSAGQYRAHRLYPDMGTCEMCNNPAHDIHHKDDDRVNNAPENIRFLCRYHHMMVDGRLEKLITNGRKPAKRIPQPCTNCGGNYFPLRRGLCHACNEYLRRNGVYRPTIHTDVGIFKQCSACKHWFELKITNKKYCDICARRIYLKAHAIAERNRRRRLRAG